MSVVVKIKEAAVRSIESIYGVALNAEQIQVNATKPEFEGDYTVVLFAFVKQLKKSPDALGQELGAHIVAQNPSLFTGFNVIKGFLNLVVANQFWLDFIDAQKNNQQYGIQPANGKKVMVEYSSPNTNKPLHLGHLRNNFLGWSIAEILKTNV